MDEWLPLVKVEKLNLFEVPVSRPTVLRWLSRGVGGRKLLGRRIGNRWYTTRRAVESFLSQSTGK